VVGTAAEVASEAIGGDVGNLAARLTRGGPNAPSLDQDARDQATGILSRARDGKLSPEDRSYLAEVVAARTGVTPDEAGAQVDAAYAEAQRLYEQALEAAERARTSSAIAAFVVAATLFVSAAAAYFAAAAGGDHRDRRLSFCSFSS
jgi:hypothetical protein